MGKLRLFRTLVILVVNFGVIQSQTIDPTFKRCPEGYTLYTDNLCYPNEKKPCPQYNIEETQTFPTVTPTNIKCPQGYILYIDNLCYPIESKPCPFESGNTTESPSITSTTTANQPAEIIKTQCPAGSIMLKNKCRKVLCPLGEYYQGKCLHPECPPGLVWRGKKCQEPGYLTTIIEVNNEIISEQNEKPITLKMSQTNEVIYHTTTTTQKPLTKPRSRSTSKNETTHTVTSSTVNDATNSCCKVFTPRICKTYGRKWLCFNRKYNRCDKRICTAPVVYLKTPEIRYEPPILIMPPNPQLNMWNNKEFTNNLNADCSGCAAFHSESCSPYCYRYNCPNATCRYMDLNEYCNYYPGQNGCLAIDGCVWNWCSRS